MAVASVKKVKKVFKIGHRYEHLEGVPKALLPGVGGKKILDFWWQIIKNRQLFSQVKPRLQERFLTA
jgi:glucuronokinase